MGRFYLTLRFAIVAALLLAANAFLLAHSRAEKIPARQDLASFPQQIGSWTGYDFPLAPDVLEVLGPGDFLTRTYQTNAKPYIELFVAYFPSQRTGDTIHSPKNCLPGAGWAPVEEKHIQIGTEGSGGFPANRYVIAKGSDRALVIYWYQAHDRRIASEYWAKFYLMADAVRMNRTDGSMIRLVTPILGDEGIFSAERRAVEFAREIIPILNRYIPS